MDECSPPTDSEEQEPLEQTPALTTTNPTTPDSARNRLWRLLHRQHFDDDDIESMYTRYIFSIQLAGLRSFLVMFIILCAVLTVLNFVFVAATTVENVCYMVLSVAYVLLLVFVHTSFMRQAYLLTATLIVLVLCSCFVVVSLPINYSGGGSLQTRTPADGLWQVVWVVYAVYAFLPLRVYVAGISGIMVSAAHVLVSILMTGAGSGGSYWLLWRQVCDNNYVFVVERGGRFLRIKFGERGLCVGVGVGGGEYWLPWTQVGNRDNWGRALSVLRTLDS